MVNDMMTPIDESAFIPWGDAVNFLKQYRQSAKMQQNPTYQRYYQQLTHNASVCSFCGVGCPFGKVIGKNGKEKLIPLSSLGLCVKGETSLITGGALQREGRLARKMQANDRITEPMIRGHDGRWRTVTWEQALDRAAWLFLHVREWVGPEGVAIYGNGQKTIEAIWMASLYKLVFQISTVGANSEHCLASAGAAHELNFGNEASFTWRQFDELLECDVALLHGTNPIVTFPQAYAKLKQNTNAVKVVIDPVESDTVIDLKQTEPDKTLHIRFEQGGDVLFNLAVARIIFEEGWQDQAYLDQAVDPTSLAEFRALCMEERCDPDVVAHQIALEGDDPADLAQTMRHYAALIAKPKANGERPRAAFVSSMGINQSTGSYGFSTNLNLLLLTGNVGRRGAGSLRIAGQSNATSELTLGFNARRLVFNLDATNAEHRQELADILEIPVENIPSGHGTPVARMADDDYLYCFIFMGTQFTRNMPRLGRWLRRLGRSFNIVIDSFLPEGALDYADVILPAFTYTERTGVIQRGDRTYQLQQQLTEPPTQSWSDEQVLARLALTIAERLEDPDTAALNKLDPNAVRRAFSRYLQPDQSVDSAVVFDHIVSVSQKLDVYNRLEDADGNPISHEMLRREAGEGVQWGGNGRYAHTTSFPRLRQDQQGAARLVRPPEKFLQQLVKRGDETLRSLITGRGRPGFNYKRYVARYNSGIKTRPITKAEEDETYWIEIHPDYAQRRGLQQGDPVRITSHHGTVVGSVSLNEHVPIEFPFLDFVPGEANRLTDYLDADRFTNQSLIKRTPIRLELLTQLEHDLWQKPDPIPFTTATQTLYEHFRTTYPTDEAADAFARHEPDAPDWLPLAQLREPVTAKQHSLADVTGGMATFLQQFVGDETYRKATAEMFRTLPDSTKQQFLTILLPLLRKLDHDTTLLPLLSTIVGTLPMRNDAGKLFAANLYDAHQNAVIEIKEEVVAVQLFLAIKYGLELLYGWGEPVPQEDLALISGIRIPCAADVPSYYMGISPSDLQAGRMIHCHVIGGYSLVVVDRRHNRALKVEIETGVLPKDKELLKLRSSVIMRKRAASRAEHARFFDRLPELITHFARVGEENFRIVGPFDLPWEEFSQKLAFAPAKRSEFRRQLLRVQPSVALVQGLIQLEILDAVKDADFIRQLMVSDGVSDDATSFTDLVTDNALSSAEKVSQVIDQFIAPVIHNDGGKIELLNFDETAGEVTVRFSGSCANCPASMLTVETLVKPPLLNIPGVYKVVHRGRLRHNEKPQRNPESIPLPILTNR